MKTLLGITALSLTLLASPALAQNLRIGLQEDPDVLDPHRARTFVGRIVFTSLCDKLVDINEKLEFVPQLAESWSWNADNTVLTFKLRAGVKFHDGEPMNAAAVKASLDRARTLPDSLRKSELASVTSVDVVDDLTVAVKVGKPDATLLAQLSDRAGMVLSPKAMAGEFGQKPVCAGPYRFVERVQNDRIVLEKFADYWNAGAYAFQRVTFLPIPDTTVRLANLRAGDLDILERLAPSDVKSVKADGKLTFAPVSGLGYQGITLNVANSPRGQNGPLKDKRVRQALQYAIERDVINDVVGEGIFPPAQQPFPEASPFRSPAFPPTKRDPAKALALLKEAGLKPPVKLELMFGNTTTTQQIAELIQAMAPEAGFEISLRPTEFAASQKEAQVGNFDANLIGWSGRVDPDGNIHQFVTCKGGLNDPKYCNEEVDRLLNEARTTTDLAKRKGLYEAAQKILQDELPIIYVYYQPWPFVTAKKVTGFKPSADGMIRLAGVKFAN
ncbi:ABC transporter substrate-binding protein [Prosthecomicrobium sp. N25]|uniref:ABC transporter substrate-binding protein n=1 Tax=Prosthecomicrobium sp. N25 TaxID=3129254 RepID=UPI003077EF03